MINPQRWIFLNFAVLFLLAGLSGCGSSSSSSPAISSVTLKSTTLTAPANITITATAAPGDGSIAKVDFFNGKTKLGEVTSAPYVFTWKNVAAGTYEIKVVVTNSKGASATKTISVTVADGGLVLIDGGTITIGNDAKANATPAHPVTVSSYYISNKELTFDEFDAFTTATGRDQLVDKYSTGRGKQPAYGITWYDAVEYLNWRSTLEGLTPVYTIDKVNKDPNNIATDTQDPKKWTVTANFSANGYRLPTEAEWEFAAKGGTKSGGFLYSGSNNVAEVAWYGGAEPGASNTTKSMGDIRLGGQLKANELGLYDMSGNVHEWVWDKYDTTAGRTGYFGSQAGVTETNPTGITGNFNRFVFRGGNSGGPAGCMLTNKRFTKTQSPMCPTGIRLARNVQ
jgi:formylglycine-generating enzyme required for sulfatase activity